MVKHGRLTRVFARPHDDYSASPPAAAPHPKARSKARSPMTDLEYEYDNLARVPEAPLIIDGWETDAAAFRKEWPHATLDVAYGPGQRCDVDVFWPGGDDARAPMVVFIHGGYWRRFDRKQFSHLARGLVSQGVAVAMPSYSLCPDTDVPGIVREMRQCCSFLHKTYRRPLTVIGHSAGAQLAACMFATDWTQVNAKLPAELVRAGLGLSGIYDLAPLLETSQNETIGLTPETARSCSPHLWMPPGVRRFFALAGGDETTEYRRQARLLTERWRMLGLGSESDLVPGRHHFDIVDELVDPDSDVVRRILDLIENPELTLPAALDPVGVDGAPDEVEDDDEPREGGQDEQTDEGEQDAERVAVEAQG